jgi:sucrose-6-phosphate hydrolase SacC (GH32 family)
MYVKQAGILITVIVCLCTVGAFAADCEIEIVGKYLNFPVKYGADKYLMSLFIDGERVREFTVELATDEPDYWVYLEVQDFIGKTGSLSVSKWREKEEKGKEEEKEGEWIKVEADQVQGLESIYCADTFPGEEDLYKEELRPQFHFSSKRGWNNDPNGLVYYKGEYHLFYQHNPFGWDWGNMTWGHAISTDLVHWVEQGDKLHIDELGQMFSGSGVVDWKNTTGFQTGDEPPLVLIYTSAGGFGLGSKGKPFTQGIAYSNDRGRTFTPYEGNPVQPNIEYLNRDPKAIWHEPTNQWVIVLHYHRRAMAFFTSRDLKSWKFESELECKFSDCPELFQLPIDGDKQNKKWILYGGSGNYVVGEFDGTKFIKETEELRHSYGDMFYAPQNFNDIPEQDGRSIQIAWARVNLLEMPFNQMMTVPVSLDLRSTDEGLRMFANPVKEINKLRGKKNTWTDEVLKPGDNPLEKVKGNLFDIEAIIDVGDANEVGFFIGGFPVVYSVDEQRLIGGEGKKGDPYDSGETQAKLELENGVITFRILVDRPSVEIFANDGRIYMPMQAVRNLDDQSLRIYSKGGNAHIKQLIVYEMNSIWRTAGN